MGGDVVSMGCEIASSHFIDRDQAEKQMEATAAYIKAEEARGRPTGVARQLLREARELLDAGRFTRAFLLAVRARGMDLETVG